MNILFLSELFYPHGGGAEYATFLYAKLLSQESINITVITNRFSKEPKVSRIGRLIIYRLPLFGKGRNGKYAILKRFDVLFSSFMRKMMKWADIVYVPRFWFSAIPLAKIFMKSVIVHLHDYIPICPLAVMYNEAKAKVCNTSSPICSPKCIYSYEKIRNRNLQKILASITLNSTLGHYIPYFIKLSDIIICVSKKHKMIIAKKMPLLHEKLQVVYNPIPRLSVKEIKGTDFGYFGGPNTLKGIRVLYKALSLLNYDGFRFLKVKVHSTKFAIQNENIRKHLNELGFALYGKLNRNELYRIYKNICAVLVPSVWHEPWPYVVVEGLLQGRFIVASRVGGIPEQIQGCKGTLLFEAGDYKALADSIKIVTSMNREEIVDLGLQNRKCFLKRFNNTSSIKSFIRVCERLL